MVAGLTWPRRWPVGLTRFVEYIIFKSYASSHATFTREFAAPQIHDNNRQNLRIHRRAFLQKR